VTRIRLENNNNLKVVILVFMVGLLQGLTLVSFPALSSVLKTVLHLSDTEYGVLFLPQVALTALGAVAGGVLARRLGLPMLLKLSLIANGLSQLALLFGVGMDDRSGFALVILGTSLLGLGFGLSAAPLNRYPIIFFPTKPDSALAALHTLIGSGLAIGPLVVGVLVEKGQWQSFPVGLVATSSCLLLLSFTFRLPPDEAEIANDGETARLMRTPAFWLLFVVAVVYAVCEGLFSNWAVIFLQEDKLQSPQNAGAALSSFWAALALGRLLTSWLVSYFPAIVVWLSFPILMAGAFLCLPYIDTAISGIVIYSFAGLSCSGFFPLTVGRAWSRFPQHAALVSSLMVAALMLGVGLGSFALGSLRTLFSLTSIFHASIVLPLLVAGLGILNTYKSAPNNHQGTLSTANTTRIEASAKIGIILCPACGGENPEDAIFCANHQCHKALGEFKYVLEELQAKKNWISRLADKVTDFIAKPHFIIFHMFWFAAWILANEGFFGQIPNFDEYPYSLLGIILAIEAVFITGFLLISQNHQAVYSEKRAELDYEVNIRSYRKLIELEKRLDSMQAKFIQPPIG
jgi:uncharacterized membrane protein/predicted MFS family arabinose efflux permease